MRFKIGGLLDCSGDLHAQGSAVLGWIVVLNLLKSSRLTLDPKFRVWGAKSVQSFVFFSYYFLLPVRSVAFAIAYLCTTDENVLSHTNSSE